MNGTKVDEGDNSNSSTDSNPEYLSPVADAGTDITVQSDMLTKLDGSKSYDPNNSGDDVRPSLNFDWAQTGGPEVILNNPSSANPTFTSPQVEEETRLTFQLVVSSDTATSDPDSETPDTPPETPDTPPETPDTPPETPDTPPETPDTPPETPDTPPETPDTPPETPDTPPETPDTPPETPDTPPETPTKYFKQQ